jgi:hypothetical protein
MLIGCTTYEPVPISAIPDWELQSEYDSLQIERGKLERRLQYGGGYTTITTPTTDFWTGEKDGGAKIHTYSDNEHRLDELDAVEDRLREIQSELSRRTIMGYQTAAPQQKYVGRGWLGVGIQNMNASLADQFGVAVTEGVLISDIQPDSPAKEASFERGDILIEYDNKAMSDVNQLRNIVAQTEVGKDVKVKVLRKGNETVLTVKIGEQP